jgi:hypothetical protein
MTQQVPVLDADLFTKLQAEVKIGEQFRATTINKYTKSGSRVCLAGFQKQTKQARMARRMKITTFLIFRSRHL